MASIKLLYIGNKLMKHGFNPTSIETLGKRLEKDFAIVKVSSKKHLFFRLLDMWLTIIRARKHVQYVLIDTYGSKAFHYSWTSAWLCQLFKLPYMPILRGGGLPARVTNNPGQSKILAKKAYAVVAPSNYLGFAFKGLSNNIKVIPNYIDIENYDFKLREDLESLDILWVRSFDKIYQPHLAIEVVNYLNGKGVPTTLTMVGPNKDGSMDACKTLADALGVAHQITFTGRLKKEDWIKESEHHNVFLSTTSIDNTPVSVMEAMALGMPVVSTKVGGVPYLFDDVEEGIMVEEQSAKALGNALLELRANKEWVKKVSTNARKKALNWDWQVVRKQWLDLLKPKSA